MPIAQSRANYTDIEAVLDTALRHNQWPVEVEFPDRKQAIRWRARASHFRIILRQGEEKRLGLPEGQGTSIYDQLTFTLPPLSRILQIKPRQSEAKIKIGGSEVVPITDRDLDIMEEELPAGKSPGLGLEID